MPKHKVFIELTPKNDNGKARLGYHGIKWELLHRKIKPYAGAPNTLHYCLRSNDGTRILWVQYQNDTDFQLRAL